MGRTRGAAYASMPGVKLVGIADIRGGSAAELADRHGVQAYASFEAAVQQVSWYLRRSSVLFIIAHPSI